jgi:hypothetical protein
MGLSPCRLSCLVLPLAFVATGLRADEVEIWSRKLTSEWLDQHVAAARRDKRTRASYSLNRTQIWANGMNRSPAQGFRPNAEGHSLGAKLQPLRDYNLLLGTELIRGGGYQGPLSSKAMWEAFMTRQWEGLGGVTFDLATAGFVDTVGSAYSQSVSGTVGIPLDLPLQAWSTELRLSPNLNLDASSGDFSAGLMSEMISQTQLSAPAGRLRSVLNITLGYGVAPSTRPVASAKLELKIFPNL